MISDGYASTLKRLITFTQAKFISLADVVVHRFELYPHKLISFKNTPKVRFFLSNFWGAVQNYLGIFFYLTIPSPENSQEDNCS